MTKRHIFASVVMALSLSCLLVAVVYGVADPYGSGQRLWTTDATGAMEINEFMLGDPVYLKTSPLSGALAPGIYTVYIFKGVFDASFYIDGLIIPDAFGIPVVSPIDVTTDSQGLFGQTTPILIWPSAEYGNYTVILDRKSIWNPGGGGGSYSPDPSYGTWHAAKDYVDDLCTAVPTPPSFHVIPEVPLGTLGAIASLFCGLGLLYLKKKK